MRRTSKRNHRNFVTSLGLLQTQIPCSNGGRIISMRKLEIKIGKYGFNVCTSARCRSARLQIWIISERGGN